MANTTAIHNLAARQKANISPQSCPTILVNSYTSCQEFSGFCARQRNRRQKHQAGCPLHYEFSLESPPTCYLNNDSMLAARLFYHLKTLVICGLTLKTERDTTKNNWKISTDGRGSSAHCYPWWALRKVPELFFEKKQPIPALQ